MSNKYKRKELIFLDLRHQILRLQGPGKKSRVLSGSHPTPDPDVNKATNEDYRSGPTLGDGIQWLRRTNDEGQEKEQNHLSILLTLKCHCTFGRYQRTSVKH